MLTDNIIGQAEFVLENIIFRELTEDQNRKVISVNQAFVDIFSINYCFNH